MTSIPQPRDERGRFVWTKQKRREAADLAAWKAAREGAPDVDPLEGVGRGSELVGRAQTGSAYPHPAVMREAGRLRDACRIRATRRTLSPLELLAIAWLAAGDLVFGRGRGAVVSLRELGLLCGCAMRTAGTVSRRLVALGVLEREPHYQPIPEELRTDHRKHVRGPNILRIAPWVRRLLTGGKEIQAVEKIPDPDPHHASAWSEGLAEDGERPADCGLPAAGGPESAAPVADVRAGGPGPADVLSGEREAPEGEERDAGGAGGAVVDETRPVGRSATLAAEPEVRGGPSNRIAWARLAHRLHRALVEGGAGVASDRLFPRAPRKARGPAPVAAPAPTPRQPREPEPTFEELAARAMATWTDDHDHRVAAVEARRREAEEREAEAVREEVRKAKAEKAARARARAKLDPGAAAEAAEEARRKRRPRNGTGAARVGGDSCR